MAGERILVVDDYPATQRIRRLTLEQAGYEVVTVGSYEEAVVVDPPPALVVSDWSLSEDDDAPDGGDVIEHFVSLGVPVIVAAGMDSIDRSPKQLGAFAVLHKPVDIQNLLSCIERALESRS